MPSVFPDGGGPSGFGSGTLREAGWAPLVLMAPLLLLRDEFDRCSREWREAPWSTGPLGASLVAVAAGIALAGVTGPRTVAVCGVNRPVLAPTNKPAVARDSGGSENLAGFGGGRGFRLGVYSTLEFQCSGCRVEIEPLSWTLGVQLRGGEISSYA